MYDHLSSGVYSRNDHLKTELIDANFHCIDKSLLLQYVPACHVGGMPEAFIVSTHTYVTNQWLVKIVGD